MKKYIILILGIMISIVILFSLVYASNIKMENEKKIELILGSNITTTKTKQQLENEYEKLINQIPQTSAEAEELYQQELELKQDFINYANQNKKNINTISKEELEKGLESKLAAYSTIIQSAKLENDQETLVKAENLYEQYNKLLNSLNETNVNDVYLDYVELKESTKITFEKVSKLLKDKEAEYSRLIDKAEVENNVKAKSDLQKIYNNYKNLTNKLTESNYKDIYSQFVKLNDNIKRNNQ